jgi:hypothetical protein
VEGRGRRRARRHLPQGGGDASAHARLQHEARVVGRHHLHALPHCGLPRRPAAALVPRPHQLAAEAAAARVRYRARNDEVGRSRTTSTACYSRSS